MMSDTAPEYPRNPAADSRRASPDRPVVETRTEARQGVTGHNVRYVLLFGTGGVALAFALIYAVFWA
jgi:hypothetical protein